MAPNLLKATALYNLPAENTAEPIQIIGGKQELILEKTAYTKSDQRKLDIVWRNVIIFLYLHGFSLYGVYLCIFGPCQWKTILWGYFIALLGGQGITSGAHRLWAHRTYKAKLPLRIFLAVCQTIALQNHIYEWVRDHRVHHKFTDTDADPHNAKRGFFFSHIGWLMVKKHKDVFIKGRTVDMSDIGNDPVVQFQMKYYVIIAPLFCFILPAFVPWYFWNETINTSWHIAVILRYTTTLNATWLVNSAAHIWGYKPYDRHIGPTENKAVAIIAFGEGWHNYHHVFPWDYKAAELETYNMNWSTAFIDFMAKLGLAYDLKTVSEDMIVKRALRTGDGTRKFDKVLEVKLNDKFINSGALWGWGDKDMKKEDIELVQFYHRKDND